MVYRLKARIIRKTLGSKVWSCWWEDKTHGAMGRGEDLRLWCFIWANKEGAYEESRPSHGPATLQGQGFCVGALSHSLSLVHPIVPILLLSFIAQSLKLCFM